MTNDGGRTLRLLSAVQPHSQFRSDEMAIERELAPGGSAELALPVRFDEAPGTVVENPFLILRVRDAAGEWRVLARVRVTAGADGEPLAGSDSVVTMQRVGASATTL